MEASTDNLRKARELLERAMDALDGAAWALGEAAYDARTLDDREDARSLERLSEKRSARLEHLVHDLDELIAVWGRERSEREAPEEPT